MRRRLIELLESLLRLLPSSPSRPTRGPSSKPAKPARPAKPTSSRPSTGDGGRPAPDGARPASSDIEAGGVQVAYRPDLDGDPDPGEVVWTWVPFEDDPSQGKDRPVLIVGHRGDHLVGVALTSKQHGHEPQVAVGTGPWDREGRPSYAKLERLLAVDPHQVRREGAILERRRFDDVIAGLERVHGPLGG
jgi:hypothetical protein